MWEKELRQFMHSQLVNRSQPSMCHLASLPILHLPEDVDQRMWEYTQLKHSYKMYLLFLIHMSYVFPHIFSVVVFASFHREVPPACCWSPIPASLFVERLLIPPNPSNEQPFWLCIAAASLAGCFMRAIRLGGH